MDQLGSIWNAPESEEELRQKLRLTALELEAARMEAAEEAKNHKDSTLQFLCLLQAAYQERDEARDQLQKILNKLVVVPSGVPTGFSSFSPVCPPQAHVEKPLLIPRKANSVLTESSSHSLSHGSSTMSSFLEGVTSPELSNINNAVVDSGDGVGHGSFASNVLDVGSSIIDDLAKGRSLPQKGKLLQAVTEAGPLLQTLLIAGRLPRWRNPPPLQPLRVPSVVGIGQRPQMCSAAHLNFSSSINPSQGGLAPSLAGGDSRIQVAKRQRQY
ncbi:hypothetical protein MLD38_003549 [Melastoma candidum]|uniref:Uncharacterized protein n=1 Tax=Melastoma candidum TaxID=119954 RepID=A0ACB9S3L6_9MYRT|nr:hypothetical protein MLD38_003549 [Melastoma candidum]